MHERIMVYIEKRLLQTLIVVVLLMIVLVGSMVEQNKRNAISTYEGKWKVTKLLTEYFRAISYYYPHHYLGRTIIVEDTSIEKSIWYWPFELERVQEEYDSSEVVCLPKEDAWVQGNLFMPDVNEFEKGENIHLIRYFEGLGNEKYCVDKFIILDDEHLAYEWIGGYYLLEPFQNCDNKTHASDLIGNWEISYLDSYANSYEGSFTDIEEAKKAYNYSKQQLNELKGSTFSVKEWFGKLVKISEETVALSDMLFEIESVEEDRVLRESFEKENGIHDGLSLYDEKINVCTVRCSGGESLLFVLVNKNQIIMHIDQGWFMLARIH